jgi:hypothetical protein
VKPFSGQLRSAALVFVGVLVVIAATTAVKLRDRSVIQQKAAESQEISIGQAPDSPNAPVALDVPPAESPSVGSLAPMFDSGPLSRTPSAPVAVGTTGSTPNQMRPASPASRPNIAATLDPVGTIAPARDTAASARHEGSATSTTPELPAAPPAIGADVERPDETPELPTVAEAPPEAGAPEAADGPAEHRAPRSVRRADRAGEEPNPLRPVGRAFSNVDRGFKKVFGGHSDPDGSRNAPDGDRSGSAR